VTLLLLERGDQGGIHAIPPTLQQSLMARLDRLGPAREVAQVGSVIGRGFSYGLLRDVGGLEDVPLQAALEKLAEADIVLVQGLPPESDYRFKHALIQDAAYENLLKSRRQVLHRRVAEILHERFADTAAAEPELLAHHFAQAGMAEASIEWWGKAGQRSLERSAFVEAVPQFRRALDQIATLPPTRALRREEIKLQVALITPLLHVEGYAAPETKKAAERARLLIEQAETLGEAPEDPLLLFSVLYSFWVANVTAFNGHVSRQLAAEFLALAEKHGGSGPLLMGHRLMGVSFTFTGSIAEGRSNFDRTIALYDAHTHRPLATRFGQDPRVACLAVRSLALWMLGYPEAALKDVEQALSEAREVGQAAALMYALFFTNITVTWCGEHSRAKALADELVALAGEKGTLTWELQGVAQQGCILALNAKPSEAVQKIAAALAGWRSTGSTGYVVDWLAFLAEAYAELGQFDDAWRCMSEAVTHVGTTGETWCEAGINRTAGKIALKLPQPDTARAQSYFERALAVARLQQAKSWELRAAMSMARFWRDQGKREEARDLLAPVYGWFTEGFDTLDLKEAKALLDDLAA
jgi:predicted ATPase